MATSTDSSSKNPPEYVELLAKSCFSFLQGASHPEEMVVRAKALGYDALALCDVNGLYGVVRGFQAAEKPSAFDAEALASTPAPQALATRVPFRLLVGAELTPHDASPLALLPMNKDGYARLSHLITAAKRPAPKGYVALSLQRALQENEDLIAFPLPPWNERDLRAIQDAFQDRVYLPVHKDLTWSSIELYRQAIAIERELKIPLFATQRPLYHDEGRKPLHDVLSCILHGTTIDEARLKLSPNRERTLKSLPELARLWKERPDMLARTGEIAKRISFSLTELRYRYPQESLPAGKTSYDHLRELSTRGLEWRFEHLPEGPSAKARAQLQEELDLIRELEYEDYFLTIRDICDFANSKGILHQGRGSAANSVVCFALGITSVDPVAMGLLFGRFISRERGEPPDIDVDFEHERREEVIQYIYSKYGESHAAMVCVTVCYRARMAVREVAKVFGLSAEGIDALTKRMGREGLKRLIDEPATAKDSPDAQRLRQILRFASEIQGFPRHLGIHSGGFVIARDPIVDVVPVEKAAMDGRYVIQWNKDDINTLGLMKIDILSLGMLTALRKTMELLKATRGLDLSLANLPQDDVQTYRMACAADTVGVFQIESRAQMALLPRLKPKRYYDLVVQIAIVRPGPIQGGMVHPYLRRRERLERVTYPHESLRPVLERTLGVPLFQEQIMQIAMIAARFTPGEADELRRIMSSHWTKTNVMDGLRQRLISGMLENGISPEFAEQIYKTIQGFSSYGFPESHSASFALLAYASVHFKCRYPDAFVCALLNSQPMGFYSPRALVADAQRHAVEFLPLDAQSSRWDYGLEPLRLIQKVKWEDAFSQTTPDLKLVQPKLSTEELRKRQREAPKSAWPNDGKFAVREGFRSIRGLQEKHVDKLVNERDQNGPFNDLQDFVQRAALPKSSLLRLAAAGAFACFGRDTRETVWMIQGLSLDPQNILFGKTARAAPPEETFPSESEWQSMRRQYQTQGYALNAHPIGVMRPALDSLRPAILSATELDRLRNGIRVRTAGLLAMMQKPPTAKGICFLSLEDETGLFNAVLMPDIYEKYRSVIFGHSLLDIVGSLEVRNGARSVRAEIVRPLRARAADDLPARPRGLTQPNEGSR